MLVLLLLAAAAILGGVIAVSMGRAGVMASFPSDYLPPDPGLSADDVAMLRPPTTLWGYNMQATDEALAVIAEAVSDRDAEIAALRHQLADLRVAGDEPQPPGAGR